MKPPPSARYASARACSPVLVVTLVLAGAGAAGAQSTVSPSPHYRDDGAATLHLSAMRHHASQAVGLHAYEAIVSQRIGVAVRTPLRDRNVYRAESAHRVFWRKDQPASIEVLALRRQAPRGVQLEEVEHGFVDHVFEPDEDRLLLGRSDAEPDSKESDFRIHHPLEPEGAGAYTLSSGDTVTLALPDGRRVTAVELRVSPRVRHPSRISGSLWIEPETGALVRAVYRLAETLDLVRDVDEVREEDERGDFRWVPGLLKPWTFEVSLVTVDYALWDDGMWLPRRWRAEGLAAAGILKIPAEFDRSYRFSRVATTDGGDVGVFDPVQVEGGPLYRALERERKGEGREVRILVADDPSALARSPHLPPPVGKDAPGFVGGDEIGEQIRWLDRVPTGAPASTPWWFRWGLQRSDLVRYNRVEELSVGARGAVLPQLFDRPLSVIGTVRLGTGDLHPNGRLDLERSTLRRSLTLSAYHELAATDEDARHLGLGNSILGAFAGRDDGDYYRRSGASFIWTSARTARESYRVSIHSEYHDAATVETRVALPRLWKDDGWAFRPNLAAEEGWEHAIQVRATPSWGTDPSRTQRGLEALVMGSVGDHEYALASLSGRMAFPLPADLRLGLAAGGAVATAGVTPQRAFAVGGPRTLRGYGPRVLVGPCGAHARIELQRRFAFGGLSAFSDAGWAGRCGALRPSAALRSGGLGLSFIDGLIRLDLARGLDDPRATRLDLYLDGLF